MLQQGGWAQGSVRVPGRVAALRLPFVPVGHLCVTSGVQRKSRQGGASAWTGLQGTHRAGVHVT